MKPLALILTALASASPMLASAEIYRCPDASGAVRYYTSRPQEPCYSRARAPMAGAARSSSPADFPRVDPATQAARDMTRRQILEAELADELRLQASVTTTDAAAHHERNVVAIRKELNAMR